MKSSEFGDIFEYEQRDWIFLAKIGDIMSACRILDTEETRKINSLYEYRSKRNENCINQSIFCFVVLQTEGFKGRMAHFAKSELGDVKSILYKTEVKLDKEDLIKIKKEIENLNSSVSGGLRKIIKNIEIK
ncbi:MAG: hypothetical protein V1686_00055 [Patescibacteria group bacterium]